MSNYLVQVMIFSQLLAVEVVRGQLVGSAVHTVELVEGILD